MKAIFKRELRSYFTTMTGYVFMAMFLVLTGILFYINTIARGVASVKQLFSLLTTWAVFILPMLTMRLFAENKNTEQLLITAPVSVKGIVFGKYFAALSVVTVTLIIFLGYVVGISFFGEINWAETISCFVGFWLLCALILAVGSFISTVSESQIVAIILTYAVLIVTVFMGEFAVHVKGSLKPILLWLSPTARFTDFTMGILDFSAIVYYFSVTALFIYFTINVIERRRFA